MFKGFRFDSELYEAFSCLVESNDYTLTDAFAKFMRLSVEGGRLIFPEFNVAGFEAEARVLADWLKKGKHSYRGDNGAEVSISGRLVGLLSRICSVELRKEVEEVLKSSVS